LVRRAICEGPPPRALSEDEQRRLLAVLVEGKGFQAERDHALFHLMLATGIRIGSALALRVEDVDLDRGDLLLRKMKGDRIVKVFLGRAIRDHLAEFVNGRRMGALFAGRGGSALSARHVQRRLRMWCERTGIRRRVSPHALRHSFAIELYGRTRDLLIVQQALRHRSIASTTVYARCDERRLREALAS
jgi:site-specific recombinase XerC